MVRRERHAPEREPMTPLPLKPEHVNVIREAMYGVTQEGTGTRVFMGARYASGGKTGTAQAVGLRQNERYNAARVDEYRRDHSLYEAFAPVDAPRVALAVIVENAGFGAAAAAPIARRVLDYLLLGVYPSEEDILAVQQARAAAPIGTPRSVHEVPLPKGVNAFGAEVDGEVIGQPSAPDDDTLLPAPTVPASAASDSAAAPAAASAASDGASR
jgi:penicillin-binding protein 2